MDILYLIISLVVNQNSLIIMRSFQQLISDMEIISIWTKSSNNKIEFKNSPFSMLFENLSIYMKLLQNLLKTNEQFRLHKWGETLTYFTSNG